MYNRISIIGGSGSGKTTLSNILSQVYNLPVLHLDGINFSSNWEEIDKCERDKIISSYAKKDKWIIDGTYIKTLKERLENSDLIIWLDYSTFSLLKGIFKRILKNLNKERQEIPGCRERFNLKFIKYVLLYNKTKRHYIADELENISNKKILIFKKQKDLNKWINNLKININ